MTRQAGRPCTDPLSIHPPTCPRATELRQHTSLFGQDTPTETLRLEACVKELRRVVGHSQLAIEKAMQAQQAFWARCVAFTCVSLVSFCDDDA